MIWMSVINAFGQAPVIQWQKFLGGSHGEYATSIIQTSDGGYAVAGYTFSNDGDVTGWHAGVDQDGSPTSDFWLARLDSAGNLLWEKCYGGSDEEEANIVIQTADGGFVLAGFSYSTNGDVTFNHGGGDYWVVKTDMNGVLQWQKSFGGTGMDYAYSIVQTPNGGYAVAGFAQSNNGNLNNNHGGSDFWLMRIDAVGMILWQKNYGGTANDEAHSIVMTPDGGFTLAGFSLSNDIDVSGNHGDKDYWLIHTDSTGNLLWEKSYGGSNTDYLRSMNKTNDGGYIMTGYTYSDDFDVSGNHDNTGTTRDYWVVKTTDTGSIEWKYCYGGTCDDEAEYIIQTNDGGYLVSGYTCSLDGDVTGFHGGYDYWILKLNNLGQIQWEQCYGDSLNDYATCGIPTSDGGYAICGQGDTNNVDYWIVKLNTTITAVPDLTSTGYSIIYPNPFSNSCTIRFNGNNLNNAELKVYDLLGQEVKSVYLGSNKQIILNRDNLPSGMYFYRLIQNKTEVISNGKFVIE